MEKATKLKILIGVAGVILVALIVVLAICLGGQSGDPASGNSRPDSDFNQQGGISPMPDAPLPPPEDLPPSVVIPPQDGQTELTFPCKVPNYDLTIERLAPYSGPFVEDGTNVNVPGVAMLLLRNHGNYPVEYTRICVQYGEQSLQFDVSALPAGEQVVVQEKTCKPMPEGAPNSASAMVLLRANLELSQDKVKVTDNGNGTLTIQNLTGQMIPTVRVFYKYYMENEDVFVGGIAFTVRITRLAAGESITVKPSHYNSKTGKVVMVLTYDTEV